MAVALWPGLRVLVWRNRSTTVLLGRLRLAPTPKVQETLPLLVKVTETEADWPRVMAWVAL